MLLLAAAKGTVLEITAEGDDAQTAIEAMKYGAFDYLQKPFEIDELLVTLVRPFDPSQPQELSTTTPSTPTNAASVHATPRTRADGGGDAVVFFVDAAGCGGAADVRPGDRGVRAGAV